jgi:anti-anti-sigma factor
MNHEPGQSCGLETPQLTGTAICDPDRGHLLITLRGEIDTANAPDLTLWLATLVNAISATGITIDLAEVTFCDVAGVRALLSAHTSAGRRDITCHVRRPRISTVRLLQVVDLSYLIDPSTAG